MGTEDRGTRWTKTASAGRRCAASWASPTASSTTGTDRPAPAVARRSAGQRIPAALLLPGPRRAQGDQAAPRRGREPAAGAARHRVPPRIGRGGPRDGQPRPRRRGFRARPTGEEIIDLLRGGQGVFNIVPLAGVLGEVDAGILRIDAAARRAGAPSAAGWEASLRRRPGPGAAGTREARRSPAAFTPFARAASALCGAVRP